MTNKSQASSFKKLKGNSANNLKFIEQTKKAKVATDKLLSEAVDKIIQLVEEKVSQNPANKEVNNFTKLLITPRNFNLKAEMRNDYFSKWVESMGVFKCSGDLLTNKQNYHLRAYSTKSSSDVVDSGATFYMVNDPNRFLPGTLKLSDSLGKIYLADDTGIPIVGLGSISLELDKHITKIINDVLLVPDLTENLFSVSHLLKDTNDLVIFSKSNVHLYLCDSNKVVKIGK